MIKELLEELDNIVINKKIKLLGENQTFIAYLICLKYLCDTGKYNYEEVIENDELYEISLDIKRINNYYLKGNKLPVNRLLILLKKFDTKELLLEFLSTFDKPIYFHQENDNIAFINIERKLFNFYDKTGNTTYITNTIRQENYNYLKIFDEILGVHNKYIFINDAVIENYDYVYIYDDMSRLRSLRTNLYQQIRDYILHNKNVILITSYNKISNFRDGRTLVKSIQTIIIEKITATILFNENKENDEISIINYNRVNDINKVIKNNRKQKDVLVKITYKELIENNYRIGFHLYQLEKTSKIKDINKIVDENTGYLERLNIINEMVEKEINKLLNR